MGRDEAQHTIEPANVERYLRDRGYEDPHVVSMHRLGESASGNRLKSFGYGKPLRIHFAVADGRQHEIVLRTMTPDPFGHSRRADRVANMVQSYDTFAQIPRHIHAADVGTFTADGALLPMANGEPFLITNYVEGELYARDLDAVRSAGELNELHLARARMLAHYLVELHSHRHEASQYQRSLRDIIGSGEGIFGLCDSYPTDHPAVTSGRLERIEHAAVRWRWRLRDASERARRTHGDFHPYNILFGNGTELWVLDCSRGAVGDPADDVCCLAINYLFNALLAGDFSFDGPFRSLWNVFWNTYLSGAGDPQLLDVVAPFFAWRALVLASPVWYAGVDERVTSTLLRFVERLLDGEAFHPDRVQVQR